MSLSRRAPFTAALLAVASVAAGCGSSGGDKEPGAAKTAVRASLPEPKAAAKAPAEPVSTRVPIADNAEADQAFVTPAGVKLTKKPPAPGAAKAAAKKAVAETAAAGETEENFISPGAPSDAEIAAELRQMEAVQKKQGAIGGRGHGIRLNPDGTATVAPDVPAVVARVVAGANAIAKFPYRYGGGHGSFVDTAYDCSGSLSYALAAGGLLKSPKVSGELARTGEKGPGEWITLYSNAGHTFMEVDGLRYDTSGRSGPLGTRWNTAPRSKKGFVVTHPPGY